MHRRRWCCHLGTGCQSPGFEGAAGETPTTPGYPIWPPKGSSLSVSVQVQPFPGSTKSIPDYNLPMSLPGQSLDIRLLVDRIPAFTWSTHPDGSVEFVNQRWREYAGLSAEESQGWGWQTAIHPEDLPSLMEKQRELLRSGEPGGIEARMRRHDGVFRWFLIRFEPFRDETGKIAVWYGVSTDIEDLKQTEEKLREDERELRQITDAIPQAEDGRETA